MDHIGLAGHEVGSLVEDEHRLVVREAAFMEEVFPEELDVGSVAARICIVDIEFFIEGNVGCGRRNLWRAGQLRAQRVSSRCNESG